MKVVEEKWGGEGGGKHQASRPGPDYPLLNDGALEVKTHEHYISHS